MKISGLNRWLAGRPLYPVRRPQMVSIEVSQRCNLRCRTCQAWRQPDPPPDLSLASFERMLNNLAGLEGTPLDLIGAEPTLNPELPAMVELASKRGFPTRLFSNGLLLRPKLVHSLVEGGLGQVTLSLDGADAATHDRLRGVPGSFAGVGRALELLQKAYGSRQEGVTLSSVLSGLNWPQLGDLLRLTRERGVGHCAVHWVSQVPSRHLGSGGASDQYAAQRDDLLVSQEDAAELRADVRQALRQTSNDSLRLLAVLPQETYTLGRFPHTQCRFTAISLNVATDGAVYPCSHVRGPSWGDMTRRPWERIWGGEARSAFLARIRRRLPPLCSYCCHHMHNLSVQQLIKCQLGLPLGPLS